MYIWFRMFRMVLLSLWEKRKLGRASPFDTLVYETRAWPSDLDINLHVTSGRINTLTDLGRAHYFIRTGIYRYALQRGVSPMLGDITAKYRREIKAFDKVVMHTRLLGWLGKWAFLEHKIVRDNRVIVHIVARALFKGRDGVMSLEDLLSHVAPHAVTQSPDLPEWLIEWHHSIEGMSQQLRADEAL